MEEKGERERERERGRERERERERELSQLTGAFTHSRIFLSLLLLWSYMPLSSPESSTSLNN